ncbi:multi-sensor signal transduction histidine kinase [Methanolacinia petrolearia DSM 11571]|uniref:histidine kinase n=1 Tax=Methanolacinia petrolearia (strain DSM 11571 / OCM 486 / SEBR 4847) TaxID=679926 RepID=E1RI90_METP4|nr:ATP-binding protein [Methanolacinia petrolearia]ADN36555.1 multi-sensor signal transduction histidine kinase [Methanolacinia petrolearia DSM 11571]
MKVDQNEACFSISNNYSDTEIIRIFVIACFILLSVLVSVLAFNIPETQWNYPGIFIIPQIYYIPILLISLWYPKKGMQASVLLIAGFLGVSSYYYYMGLPVDPFIAGLNVAMIIWVVITTTYLAESSGLVNIKYRAFFRNAGAGMLIFDINNFRILDANEKAKEILGVHDDEIIGKKIESLIDMDDLEPEMFYDIDNKKFELYSGNGKRTISLSSHFNDSLGHIECTILDITEQETEKKNAKEIKMKMLEFLRSSSDLIFVLDLNGIIKSFDLQTAGDYDIKTSDYIGKPVEQFIPEDSKIKFSRYFEEVIDTGCTTTFETKISIKGENKTLLIIIGAITSAGKTEEVLVALHEIGNNLPDKEELILEFEKRRWANFINTAAHELRTPLQPILGYLHLLTDKDYQAEMSPEVASIIEKCLLSTERECEIVEKILEAGLSESFKINLNVEEIELKQLVEEILNINKIRCNAEVIVDLSDSVRFNADRDRIYQVFEGIILNAVKYNSDPKKVSISYREDDSNHIISISDNGIGIPPDSVNDIFEPFFIRNSSDLVRGTGRIGLGLSIAKRYISLHKGDIRVQSVPGEGSTFTVILPKKI